MNIQSITFHNQEIQVLNHDGKPYVAMRSIVENIGLDWASQYRRIKSNEVLHKGIVMMTTPSKGGIQEILCLPLGYLNGWLFGIEINRVKPEIREVLKLYQLECFDVLYRHFMPVAENLCPMVKSNIANAPENLNSSRTFAVALMNNGLKKHDEITLAYDMLRKKLLRTIDEVKEIERMIFHISVNNGDIHDGMAEAKTYLFLDGQIYKDAVAKAKEIYKPLNLPSA